MNSVMLNHIPLDGNMVIKKGGSGGSGGGIKYTGHADAEGLKAIGWTDEDIAYYQANGVNWNEEDDEYHKVTDDNKALYGVLTIDNIDEYKDRIVYLPKIDTSGVTSMANKFHNHAPLVGIPLLDTSNVVNMSYMFYGCYSLTTIPLLDTSRVINMSYMFSKCTSLVAIPMLNIDRVTEVNYMFEDCRSLMNIPMLLDTRNFLYMNYLFYNCFSLTRIPMLDVEKVKTWSYILSNCRSLVVIKIKNLKYSIEIYAALLNKESLLYIINNEATTAAKIITLHSYAYSRLAEDADIVNALTNHPNISLASA